MKKIVGFIFVTVSIPVLVINFFYNYNVSKIISGFIFNDQTNETTIRVLKNDNKVEELNIEDYLVGVVAGEVPVYFEEEALKAQAVAARTYALKQKNNNSNHEYDVTATTSSQVYKTDDELKKQWLNNYDEYIDKIKKAVNDTQGEFISYNNDPIYAFFFSTSNGYTENNVNVFGQDLPYLQSVDSSFDLKENKNAISTKDFSIEEFYSLLGLNYSNDLKISIISKSETGRILNLKVNDIDFKGRDFQKKLSLRSNDFEIKRENDRIKITTKGFGHGVGLSQYGANALAKQKKNYKEILNYYYKNTKIEKL